jgi:hypothetical protein
VKDLLDVRTGISHEVHVSSQFDGDFSRFFDIFFNNNNWLHIINQSMEKNQAKTKSTTTSSHRPPTLHRHMIRSEETGG